MDPREVCVSSLTFGSQRSHVHSVPLSNHAHAAFFRMEITMRSFVRANEQSGSSPVSTLEAYRPASLARFLTILTFIYPINNALRLPQKWRCKLHPIELTAASRKSRMYASVVLSSACLARICNTECLFVPQSVKPHMCK